MPGIDILRLLSVSAIVWFHAKGPCSEYFGFRLPTVALITCFVHARGSRWRPEGLLIPWVFWAIVYGAVLAYRVSKAGRVVMPPWYILVLAGPGPVLWYAPFALLSGFLAFRFARAARWQLLLGMALALLASHALHRLPRPGPSWSMVLPALPAGILLARRDAGWIDVAATAVVALVFGGLASATPVGGGEAAPVAATIGMAGTAEIGPLYLIASILVFLMSRWRGRRVKWLPLFGRGVYWGHMVVILVLYKIDQMTPWTALAGAFVLAALLVSNPWTKKLV
jgi:hypothetical protein